MQVLGTDPGKSVLKDPGRLKYLLAPILAKSATEQEKFYLVFDQYLQDIRIPPQLKPLPRQTFVGRHLWWLLPAAFLLGGLIYLLWPRPGQVVIEAPVVLIAGPTAAQLGDTLLFTLSVEKAQSEPQSVEWFLIDGTSKEIERRESGGLTWSALAAANGRSPVKIVQARVRVPGWDSLLIAETSFGIFCADPPEYKTPEWPASLEVEEEYTFSPPSRFRERDYAFEWNFGDGASSTERAPVHKYTTDGVYFLQLKITRKSTDAICTGEVMHRIAIGEENILLEAPPLQYDLIYPRATWGWGAWLLLSVLAISIFYYMVRWMKRPYPEAPDAAGSAKEDLPAPDKGPYFIPFRPLDSLILTEPVHYRLADMLRLRQEGLRREVDVMASVKATIEEGGYPNLLFRTNTQPTDYLILLDLQSGNSHQARFFQYLSASLSQQDVVAEVFYYKTDLFRLWNPTHPNGINLDMVYRLYPDHRLIIMGDGHELLDPYASGKPALRPGTAQVLKSWKQRLLLSPVAPDSWTFREAVLAELFVVFPADTEGLAKASQYIENGLEPSDLPPSFREWQEALAKEREDVDINYHQWRTAADHEAYLANDPHLMRWLRALAVFPSPVWEMTLAIGHALGIEPRFNDLLKLSRIPWLQNGDLHPRLRRQLLAGLDKQDEYLARQAVKNELEAIADSVQQGFAGFEVQTNLAVQNFILSPYDPGNQNTVRACMKAGVLHPVQIEELAKALPDMREKFMMAQMNKMSQMAMESAYTPEPPGSNDLLEQFLESQEQAVPPPPPPKRPVVTADLWRMILSGIAFALMIVLMWRLDSTDWLYRTVFRAAPEPYLGSLNRTMRDFVLVKESVFIDSLALLNNEGVEVYYQDVVPELERITGNKPPYTFSATPQARDLFLRALAIKPGYPVAQLNIARLDYAVGAAIFNANRKGESAAATWISDSLALGYFRQAAVAEEVRHSAQHALGLTHYYMGQRDSALYYFNALQSVSYFDTLAMFPNLKILLGQQETALFDVRLRNPNVRSVEAIIDYYINPKGIPKLRWELTANDDKGSSPFVRRAEAQAKFRRNSATLQIQTPEDGPEFRTNTLRLRLRNLTTDSLLIDSLLYWPKNWNIRKVPDRTTLKTVTMDESLLEIKPSVFNLIGQVVDSVSGQPLAGVAMILQGDPTKQQRTADQRMETITDARGYFSFKISELPSYRMRIQAIRANYVPYFADLPPLNPTQGDQRIDVIRLRPAPPDMRQQNIPRKSKN